MLRLLAAYVGWCLCALAQESVLTIYLDRNDSVTPPLFRALQQETSRLLEPLSTAVLWRDTSSPQEHDGRLVVVRFEGSCSFSGYSPARSALSKQSESLAFTAISGGHILPFVTIRCSNIRDFVASSIVGLKEADRNSALGKAVGRVLAHEIFHVLSGKRMHAASGVAGPCLSTRDLLAQNFDFESASLSQMRQVRHEPVSSDEPGTDLEAVGGGR